MLLIHLKTNFMKFIYQLISPMKLSSLIVMLREFSLLMLDFLHEYFRLLSQLERFFRVGMYRLPQEPINRLLDLSLSKNEEVLLSLLKKF